MQFEVVNTSDDKTAPGVRVAGADVSVWPVYETEDLLMCRARIPTGTQCEVAASDLTYFIYVAEGEITYRNKDSSGSAATGFGLEIPEGEGFVLEVLDDQMPASLIMVVGKELLPGSFFNTLNNAYA